MPGHTPQPDGGQNMQAPLASFMSERNMRETTRQRQQEQAQFRFAAAVAEARTLAILDAYDFACASCNALPLMSHAGDEGKAATGQLHSNSCADGKMPALTPLDSARDTPSLPQMHTTASIERGPMPSRR